MRRCAILIALICYAITATACAFKYGDWDCRTTIKRTKCKIKF
jgi:hypothetical protein